MKAVQFFVLILVATIKLGAQSITNYYLYPSEPAPFEPIFVVVETVQPWGPCTAPAYELAYDATSYTVTLDMFYTPGPLDPILNCTDTIFVGQYTAGSLTIILNSFLVINQETTPVSTNQVLAFNIVGASYEIVEDPFDLGTSCGGLAGNSAYRSISITNTGNVPLELIDVVGIEPPFVLESALPFIIESAETNWLSFIFNPDLESLPPGLYTDDIHIITNAYPNSYPLTLSAQAEICSGIADPYDQYEVQVLIEQENLRISTPNNEPIYRVDIVNLMGQRIDSFTGNHYNKINSISSGIYMLKISTTQNKITKKIYLP